MIYIHTHTYIRIYVYITFSYVPLDSCIIPFNINRITRVSRTSYTTVITEMRVTLSCHSSCLISRYYKFHLSDILEMTSYRQHILSCPLIALTLNSRRQVDRYFCARKSDVSDDNREERVR